MDHQQQHHEHHRKEREHKKQEQKAYEARQAKNLFPLQTKWLVILGIVLVGAAMLVWTLYLQ